METACCVAVIDSDGRFVFINSQFQKELKASVIKIMHKTWFDYVHPDDLEICRHTLACAVLTGRQASAAVRLKERTDKIFNWEISQIIGDEPAGERFLVVERLWKTTEKNADPVPHEDSHNLGRIVNEAILRAREHERTTIGQELHDNVNQILFTSKLYLDLIKPTGHDQIVLKIKTEAFILMAIDEIRKLSKGLVSPRLMDLGLITCIRNLIDDLILAAIFRTDLTVRNENEIEEVEYNIRVTLFRIIQEQVKNIIKYSRAQRVSVQLWMADEQVYLLIEDDGVGFDPGQVSRGIGLANIYDRARLFNGKVDLDTAPGKGCRLMVTMPAYSSEGK
jgi:signal transduction histidine kinase